MSFIKRAALYIRVSSDEQARHGLSLGEQRLDLQRYAESHGYAVTDVYADEGVSARKPMRVRKELQRLLSDVKQKKIDIIVIKCLDRWFRNIADYHKVQEILDEYGVNWECSQDRYDTTTAAGRLNLNIRLAIAQDEADRTSERIKYVFNGKRERREVLGGKIPLGFKIENKRIVPDESNAAIVRYIFQSVSEGCAMNPLPKKIYDEFGVNISRFQIADSLRNRAYIGEYYGIPGYCPEIVETDVFERVQTILDSHIKKPPSGRVYLFSGLICCPNCGRRLISSICGEKDKNGLHYLQYRCSRNSNAFSANRCSFSRTIFEKKLERYLLDNLQGFIAQHTLAVETRRAEKQKETNGVTLESINAKMERLKDLYVDGNISKATYKADYEKLQKLLAEISRKIDRLPTVSPALQAVANEKDFRAVYDGLTQENKKEFWRSIISKIEFDDTPDTRGAGKTIPFRVIFL